MNAPFAIAYLTPRILRHVTAFNMTDAGVTRYLDAMNSLADDLQQAAAPFHMLFDAREKSFAKFDAQKRISLGMRERLEGRPIGRTALVSMNWQGAGNADGIPSFDDIPAAWRHLTGGPDHPWPAVSLVSGSTGAGKSTFSRYLCAESGALHLSIDEWMTTLYFDDRPTDPDAAGFDWYMARIGRIEALMRVQAEQLVANGTPVVLDLGFTTRDHRSVWLDWAAALPVPHVAPPRLHFVDLPADARWRNVELRNRAPDRHSMHVTRDMFDFMEARFEPPTADEGDLAVVRW
ncbi:MAG: ATP-binding protein [Nitrospirota bacterium]|nr:ATP-binding protein [Nitrospirota bacterium]